MAPLKRKLAVIVLTFVAVGCHFAEATQCRKSITGSSNSESRAIRPSPVSADEILSVMDLTKYNNTSERNRALQLFGMKARPNDIRAHAAKPSTQRMIEKFRAIAWDNRISNVPILDQRQIENRREFQPDRGQSHDRMFTGKLFDRDVIVKADIVTDDPESHVSILYETALGLLFNKFGEGPQIYGVVFLRPNLLGVVMEKVNGVHIFDLGTSNNITGQNALKNASEALKLSYMDALKRVYEVFDALTVRQARQSELEFFLTPTGDIVPIDFAGQIFGEPGQAPQDIRATKFVFRNVSNSIATFLNLPIQFRNDPYWSDSP